MNGTSGWADLLSPEFLADFEMRQASEVDAIPTPLSSWNAVCGDDGGNRGLALAWLVTIGGNPGFGKTLLALSMAYTALANGWPVGFISLEMSEYQLAGRLFSLATGTPISRLQRGEGFDHEAFRKVKDGLRQLIAENRMARFVVNREHPHTVDDLLVSLRILNEQGINVIYIDYLQLIGLGSEDKVYERTAEVVSHIRDFAVRTGSLVVGLSQFNRTTSSNYAQSPMAQGLHGGMILEASSDQVLLLDHSRYSTDPANPRIARSWASLAKNRHGPRGEIPILWDYSTLRVREGLPDEMHEWPGDKR